LEPKIVKGRDVVNITIRENDHPYGLFRISVDMATQGQSVFVIEEPDDRLPVQVHIDRDFGKFVSHLRGWNKVFFIRNI